MLNADGSRAPDSKVVVDMTRLSSDQSLRDGEWTSTLEDQLTVHDVGKPQAAVTQGWSRYPTISGSS